MTPVLRAERLAVAKGVYPAFVLCKMLVVQCGLLRGA